MANPSNEFQDLSPHFLNRMRNLPMLTVDEEYQLAKKWRENQDKKAVEKLVSSHLRLVAKIANGYRGYGLPLSDLISEGNVGMMQAMRHFDPEKGFRLSTYAIWWIKAAIQDYIMHSWSMVKMGTTAAQKKLFFNIRKERNAIRDTHDVQLTPDKVTEIALKLGVKEEEVIFMNHRMAASDHSLNAQIKSSGEGESEWIEWLADDRDDPEVMVVEKDEATKRKALLDKAMDHLDFRERHIIEERRLKDDPQTLESLSDTMGISRERVRQIEVRAFEKLQKAIKRLSRLSHENV